MSSGNFLNIGISGLLSSQAAITTTSNNIANVNTEGYSRQFVDFSANQPDFLGGNFIGTGVISSNVKRVFDELALFDLRANISNFNSLDTYITQAERVDRVVADPSTGLSPAIQGFFDAIQAVADDPASVATRQSLFSQSDLLIERFRSLNTQFVTQRDSINSEFRNVSGQITTLGRSIAEINSQIVFALGKSASGAEPNDLLDKRDTLINKLSELVQVQTIEQDDGAINVFIGNGQTLVIGNQSNTLRTASNPEDPYNVQLELVTAGTAIPVTNDLTGGKIGGLLQYRNDLLQPAINRLGLVSLGLISSINAQHTQGMDLNGALGNNFFSELNSPTLEQDRVFANSSNSGNGNITMTIDDISAVSSSEYRLTFNSGTFTITDSSNGQVLDTFVAPAVPGSYQNTSLGFTLNFNSGALVDGDSYNLSPTRNAVENLERALTDITQIAVAIPVSATANLGNSGSAEIIGASVSDTSNASFTTTAGALAPPIRFEFTSATTYDVISNDGSNTILASGVTFNANQTNNMLAQAGLDLGYEVQVGGGANSGDIFEVAYNTSGRGDNRNALAMANIQTQNILNQGTSTLQETYGLLVSEVGTRTNEYTISLNATESLLRQNQARLEEVSGVNLDEEAAKLIKFQQSYQAAARIITTSNVIFDTLIASVN